MLLGFNRLSSIMDSWKDKRGACIPCRLGWIEFYCVVPIMYGDIVLTFISPLDPDPTVDDVS